MQTTSNSISEEVTTPFFPEVLRSIQNDIEMTDFSSEDDLRIYSYKQCNNQSLDEVKKCRGVVFHGETPLFRSLGYTSEYTEEEVNILDLSFDDSTFYRSEEGTLLRLFFHNGKWYLSTHRKLDASKSRWGGGSPFGEIFLKGLQNTFGQECDLSSFTQKLDIQNVYLFLIRSTKENRMVCKAPAKETLLHVCTMIGGQTYDTEIDVGVEKPKPLSFSDKQEVIDYVSSIDPFTSQGVIVFQKDGSHLKIVSTKYQLYSNVRGNESSIMFRYLQVRSNPSYVAMLNELYPEKSEMFLKYENAIFQIAKGIHFSYMERFINKKHVVVPKEEYTIIRECHGWHIQDRQNNKVSANVVISFLTQQKYVSLLNFLIKKQLA